MMFDLINIFRGLSRALSFSVLSNSLTSKIPFRFFIDLSQFHPNFCNDSYPIPKLVSIPIINPYQFPPNQGSGWIPDRVDIGSQYVDKTDYCIIYDLCRSFLAVIMLRLHRHFFHISWKVLLHYILASSMASYYNLN